MSFLAIALKMPQKKHTHYAALDERERCNTRVGKPNAMLHFYQFNLSIPHFFKIVSTSRKEIFTRLLASAH